jgi:protein-S-isoprenylcysteine O-methyltransferase Ste14
MVGWSLVLAQFALLAVVLLAPTGTAWPAPPGGDALRSAISAVGFVLVVVGVAQLGLAARIHPAPAGDAKLRTGGAYRFVRHPIYTGVLVLAAVAAVTGRSLWHAAALIALVAVLAVKARYEEQLLSERFDGYTDYARRTGRFVPGVGRLRS